MQEVQELALIHDQLKDQIIAKYGKLDEEVYEKEEAEYWVRRGVTQSIWDMRSSGRIGIGNQELLENIGLNPRAVSKMITTWLSESNCNDLGTAPQEAFLSEVAKVCKNASGERLLRIGISDKLETKHLLLEEEV